MNSFRRWCRFNLVGVVGMMLQFATLTLFNHCMPGHYLYATAAAIELTLLHNFVWHVHYTWRDRGRGPRPLASLVRFHVTNGLVSMAGNLILMRILVGKVHLPLLASNGIAVLCCSVVNFVLSDFWTFSASAPSHPASAVTIDAGEMPCEIASPLSVAESIQ